MSSLRFWDLQRAQKEKKKVAGLGFQGYPPVVGGRQRVPERGKTNQSTRVVKIDVNCTIRPFKRSPGAKVEFARQIRRISGPVTRVKKKKKVGVWGFGCTPQSSVVASASPNDDRHAELMPSGPWEIQIRDWK